MKSLKEFLKFILVIFVLMGSFITWSWCANRSVRGFCDDVKPGTLVIALSAMAEAHHTNSRWLHTYEKEKGSWITFLPVQSTFGEVACEIEHDKTVVHSSRMR
jgi:hypothetical protein